MKILYLKVLPEYFRAILSREKNFEIRKNDRDFQVGDVLVLLEYDIDKKEYTDRVVSKKISYILPGGQFGVEEGYCIMGLKNLVSWMRN